MRRRSVRITVVSVGTVVVLAGAAVAYAAIPSNGVITGCYSRSGGILRVIDATAGSCSSKETSLTWNAQGAQGDPGDPGGIGPQGTAGVSGYQLVHVDTPLTGISGSGSTAATCPTGTKALGGGATFIDEFGNNVIRGGETILTSSPTPSGSAWAVSYEYGSPTSHTLRTYVTCANVG